MQLAANSDCEPKEVIAFLAARARSTKFAADARSKMRRGGGDRGHSFTAQRGLFGQFTGRGTK